MRKFIAIFAFIILPFHSFAVNHTVDKTDFIKAIIEDNHKVLLITRPPNWGKSSILMELEKFFTPNIKTDCSCNHIIEQYKEQFMSIKNYWTNILGNIPLYSLV
jgi:hypothetical protein